MSPILLASVPAVLVGAASPAPPGVDRTAIEVTIGHYFRAGDENSPAELKAAFHATLGMFWVTPDGVAHGLSRAAWANRLTSAGAPQRAALRRIEQVDLTGDLAAAALHSEFSTHHFEDFVSLVRIGGRWRIVLKLFHRRAPADAPLPDPSAVESDREAITRLLQENFRARDDNDGVGVSRTYLPRAMSYSVEDGELVAVPFTEWQARAEEAKALGKSNPLHRRIESIQLAADVALVKVASGLGAETGVEYLSLLKVGREWKLVGMIYGPR
jgi:hypothetical protein